MDQNIEVSEELILERKHKKERKELQAQIQALKKAARNDKTKKKELTAEIARLETELDQKHKLEIESIETETEATKCSEVIEPSAKEDSAIRVSKAQRRRDKKMQLEKERSIQIKLQEKENANGPRILEMQALCARLKDRNLDIYTIPSDGDCLYRAVAHQLQLKHNKTLSVDDLRSNVAIHIHENKDDFIPFLTNPVTYEMLTESEFNDYCDKIRLTKVWGGQLEIRALSNILKCPITVIQATGPEAIEQGSEFSNPPLVITYHRHMFSLGEHYNSTQTLQVLPNV